MARRKPPKSPPKTDVSLVRSSAAEYLTFVAATGGGSASVAMRYEDQNLWLTQKTMAISDYKKALKYVLALPAAQQAAFIARLDRVRQLVQNVGWGVGDDFDHSWSEAGLAGDE